MSGIEAHVLHADDFLALMLGDGVPDGHVIGGQVQLVGAGQRVVAGERVREGLLRAPLTAKPGGRSQAVTA